MQEPPAGLIAGSSVLGGGGGGGGGASGSESTGATSGAPLTNTRGPVSAEGRARVAEAFSLASSYTIIEVIKIVRSAAPTAVAIESDSEISIDFSKVDAHTLRRASQVLDIRNV